MNMTKSPGCPIPQAHSRLNHAFSMFEEITARYQKPDEFTVTLNDLIQALRNITFILQAEKENVKDFDKWYAPHQKIMKEDEALSWLNDARVHVVHRGDLEKKSHLTLRIKDHLDQVLLKEAFDPYIPLSDALIRFKRALRLDLPKFYEEETIIEAEREWVVDTFPKAEITDVLIYCLSMLTGIIYEAHGVCGIDPMHCPLNAFVKEGEDFLVVIRNKVKKGRVLKMLYKEDRALAFKNEDFSPFDKVPGKEETYGELAEKRYGPAKEIIKSVETKNRAVGDLPFNKIELHIRASRHFFAIDGHVQPIAFLYFPDRSPMMIQLELKNPEDRYLMAELIAEKVEETHCAAVLMVGETWSGEPPMEGRELIPPRLQENKKEHVMVLAASPARTEMCLIEIKRNSDGSASLGKEVKETNPNGVGFFSRIYKVWEYQQRNQ